MAGSLVHRQRALQAKRAANRSVQVAVVGAGVVGTTYAVHLARVGMDVTLLSRGARAQELASHGAAVRDLLSRRRVSAPMRYATTLAPDTPWDLAIMAVGSDQVAEAADLATALGQVTPVLWLQDTPTAAALAETLGERSVLLGFPATGGSRARGEVYSLPLWTGSTVLGESDGSCTPRLQQAAAVLRHAGLKVEIERHMLFWLETHAAMMVVLAGAVGRSGGIRTLARNAAEIEFYGATLREAWGALEASGIPITPAAQRQTLYRPRWLQQLSMRLSSMPYWVGVVVDEHLSTARSELAIAYESLMARAAEAGVSTPLLASLAPYLHREG